ncbi:hypothetical protein AAH978_03960 [Streptomyces sp. ZYX-F-203]
MPHLDQAHLLDLALGRLPAGSDAMGVLGHLHGCVRCRGELARVRALVATARAARPSVPAVAPPARVWDRIARELSPPSGAPRPRTGKARRAAASVAPALLCCAALAWWARGRARRPPARRTGGARRARGPGVFGRRRFARPQRHSGLGTGR